MKAGLVSVLRCCTVLFRQIALMKAWSGSRLLASTEPNKWPNQAFCQKLGLRAVLGSIEEKGG